MSERIIHDSQQGEQVVTENGISTVTSSVMKLVTKTRVDYATTHDPVTGINKPLIEAVMTQLSTQREFWDQNVWRRLVTTDEGVPSHLDDTDVMQRLAFIADDIDAPACGTALCCAGWVAEIARVDWVVDATAIREFAKRDALHDLESWEAFAFIRRDDPAFAFITDGMWEFIERDAQWPAEGTVLAGMVAERGFSIDTHRVVYTPVIGYAYLGIFDASYVSGYALTASSGDPFHLFDGNNEYEAVMTILGAYLRFTEPVKDTDDADKARFLRESARDQGFPDWAFEVAGFNGDYNEDSGDGRCNCSFCRHERGED